MQNNRCRNTGLLNFTKQVLVHQYIEDFTSFTDIIHDRSVPNASGITELSGFNGCTSAVAYGGHC